MVIIDAVVIVTVFIIIIMINISPIIDASGTTRLKQIAYHRLIFFYPNFTKKLLCNYLSTHILTYCECKTWYVVLLQHHDLVLPGSATNFVLCVF